MVVGASALATGAVVALVRLARPVAEPVARTVLSPPVLPVRMRPATWVRSLGRRGAEQRTALTRDASRLLDELVPIVAEEVLRRADLTTMIIRYIDPDRIVAQVDLDVAAERIDVAAVLDRVDLTAVVLERVDLDALVQAVLDRIDLAKLAAEVIDAIDLPEIIRESTGSMASDTVRSARMQGIVADQAVGRVMERLLLRRPRSVEARDPGQPGR